MNLKVKKVLHKRKKMTNLSHLVIYVRMWFSYHRCDAPVAGKHEAG